MRVGDHKVLPFPQNAGMAKLVDALDLGSSGATHRSSSLLTRTILRVCRASYGAARSDNNAKTFS